MKLGTDRHRPDPIGQGAYRHAPAAPPPPHDTLQQRPAFTHGALTLFGIERAVIIELRKMATKLGPTDRAGVMISQ